MAFRIDFDSFGKGAVTMVRKSAKWLLVAALLGSGLILALNFAAGTKAWPFAVSKPQTVEVFVSRSSGDAFRGASFGAGSVRVVAAGKDWLDLEITQVVSPKDGYRLRPKRDTLDLHVAGTLLSYSMMDADNVAIVPAQGPGRASFSWDGVERLVDVAWAWKAEQQIRSPESATSTIVMNGRAISFVEGLGIEEELAERFDIDPEAGEVDFTVLGQNIYVAGARIRVSLPLIDRPNLYQGVVSVAWSPGLGILPPNNREDDYRNVAVVLDPSLRPEVIRPEAELCYPGCYQVSLPYNEGGVAIFAITSSALNVAVRISRAVFGSVTVAVLVWFITSQVLEPGRNRAAGSKSQSSRKQRAMRAGRQR